MQSLFCVHHKEEPIKGICFFQGQCDDRLMCRACRKTHDSNHLNYYEELDDDFYNGSLVIQLKEEFDAMIKALDSQNSTYENSSRLLISQIDYFINEIQTHIIQRLTQTKDTLVENINKKLQKNNSLKQEIRTDGENMANAYDRAITSKFNPPSTADAMVQAIYKAQALFEKVNNDPELQAQSAIEINLTQLATSASANRFREIKASLDGICQDIEGSFTLNNPIKQLSIPKGRILQNEEFRYNNPSSSANLFNMSDNRRKPSEPKRTSNELLKYFLMAERGENGEFDPHRVPKYSRGKESRSRGKRMQILEFCDQVTTNSNQIMMSGLAEIPDLGMLAVAEKQGMIEVINVQSLERVKLIKAHNTEICCILYVPEKKLLLSADANGLINVWDCQGDFKFVRAFAKHTKAVLALEYFPDQELVVSGGDDECIRMWSIKTFKEEQTMRTKQSKIGSLCRLGNSKIAVGFDKGVINVIAFEPERKVTLSFPAHNKHILSLKYLEESNILISSSEDGFIKIWEILDKGYKYKSVGEIPPEGSIIRNFLVFENNNLLVANYSDKNVRIYNLTDGEKLDERFDKSFGESLIALENTNQIATGNVSEIKFWALNIEGNF